MLISSGQTIQRHKQNNINKLPGLEIAFQCENPLRAQALLIAQKIDLLFLDINMPEMTGLDFLKSLNRKPLTILISAHPDYALQSYELDVIDYLLKPVSFERFNQAVNKAIEYHRYYSESSVQKNDPYKDGYFYVKADYRIIRVEFADIQFIKGMREYVQIYTEKQNIITHLTMQKLCEILPSVDFYRIHKSYIVNIRKIQMIEGNLLKVGKYELQISKNQRKDFFSRIDHLLIS